MGYPAERERQRPGQQIVKVTLPMRTTWLRVLGHKDGAGRAQGRAPAVTLVLPRLPEPGSLQQLDSDFWGSFLLRGVCEGACCDLLFPSSSPPRSNVVPSRLEFPPTPPPAPPNLSLIPTHLLPQPGEAGRVSSWEPEGFSYKPPSFVVVISPSFLPFILKIALSFQAPPSPHPTLVRNIS